MNIPKSIKTALRARGLLSKELDIKLGYNRGAISKISTGESIPSLTKLYAISKELNYKLSDFIALGEDEITVRRG